MPLAISIPPGSGLAIGPDIVVKVKRKERDGEVRFIIEAPANLRIERIDAATANMIIDRLRPTQDKH